MNKKGFTLIELLAVVVIMAIIALIATPNIVNMMDKGKKEDYVADAKEIISKATYMYKLEKYRNNAEIFSEGSEGTTIKLENINGIDDDFKDPYGFTYDKTNSYVEFTSSGSSGPKERQVKITLISKKSDSVEDECYTIDTTDKNALSAESVKQGKWSGTYCEPSTS
ncbi:MAG: type II secretion system protein [Bacilli bacterium]